MINLARAEFNRLRSRRVVVICLIVLLAALGGFQVIVGFTVRQPSQAAIAQARQQFEHAKADYDQNHDAEVKLCQQQNPDQADSCDYPPPKWDDFLPKPATFTEMATAGVTITVIFTSLIFLIIGASSIGAEYGSGAIANWLSFVPDRLRVYASKLGVLVISAAVVAALASALSLACTAILVKINSGRVVHSGDQIAAGGRGLIVVVVCTALGFGLALISRHTIAALGVLVGYLVFDFVLVIVMNTIESAQKIKPWLPENNARAVLGNGYRYDDLVQHVRPDGIDYEPIARHIGFGHGLAYLTVVFVLVVAVSLLVFRRRDIT